MEGLNSVEQTVLAKLLAGEHDVLATLRKQTSTARLAKRELTGVDFFCWLDVAPDAPLVEDPRDFKIDDVHAEIAELTHGAEFVLFIRGGRLDNLEGFTYDEGWPEQIHGFSLRYTDPERKEVLGKLRL